MKTICTWHKGRFKYSLRLSTAKYLHKQLNEQLTLNSLLNKLKYVPVCMCVLPSDKQQNQMFKRKQENQVILCIY